MIITLFLVLILAFSFGFFIFYVIIRIAREETGKEYSFCPKCSNFWKKSPYSEGGVIYEWVDRIMEPNFNNRKVCVRCEGVD